MLYRSEKVGAIPNKSTLSLGIFKHSFIQLGLIHVTTYIGLGYFDEWDNITTKQYRFVCMRITDNLYFQGVAEVINASGRRLSSRWYLFSAIHAESGRVGSCAYKLTHTSKMHWFSLES